MLLYATTSVIVIVICHQHCKFFVICHNHHCVLFHFCSNICLLCHHHVQKPPTGEAFWKAVNVAMVNSHGLKFWTFQTNHVRVFLRTCLKDLCAVNWGRKLDSPPIYIFFWNGEKKRISNLGFAPTDFFAKRVPSNSVPLYKGIWRLYWRDSDVNGWMLGARWQTPKRDNPDASSSTN